MNYQHSYHAGSFADVVKHSVLCLILDYLRQKDTPFCYIDSHAGSGLYDLQSPQAQKTSEASTGILRLLQTAQPYPESLQPYWNIIAKFTNQLNYPGSPLIAYDFLRDKDHMILNDYHAESYQHLRKLFRGDSQVMIHQRDAYEFLSANLPPKLSRGVALIDPAFENKQEHQHVKNTLQKCLKHWAHGIYVIWYPVTTTARWNLTQLIPHSHQQKYLLMELCINSNRFQEKGLVGCNLLVLNPPWQLHQQAQELLAYLWEIFSINRAGQWSVSIP